MVTTKPKKNHGEVIIDEVSTLPDNLKIKVDNGVVRVVDAATGKNVIYPSHKDEHEPRDDIKPLPIAQIKGRQKLAEKKEKTLKKLKMKRKQKNDMGRAASLKQKMGNGEMKKEEAKPKVEEVKSKQQQKPAQKEAKKAKQQQEKAVDVVAAPLKKKLPPADSLSKVADPKLTKAAKRA